MARQPKDLEYRAEFEPDTARMVKALRILLEYDPRKESQPSTAKAVNETANQQIRR